MGFRELPRTWHANTVVPPCSQLDSELCALSNSSVLNPLATNFPYICVLAFAFFFGGQFVIKHTSRLLFGYFSASVTIYNYDPIYDNILEWVAEQAALRQVRNLRGYNAGESYDEDGDEMKTV